MTPPPPPLVRVVIPTFNRADLLEQAVASVRAQSFTDFEIVISDDGSTDGTGLLVERLMRVEPRIRYEWHENQGLAETRNIAIALPGAFTYVALLDSDDLWKPTHLERAVALLESARDVAFVFSRYDAVDATGRAWTAREMEAKLARLDRCLDFVSRQVGPAAFVLDAGKVLRGLLTSEIGPHPSTVVARAAFVPRWPWYDKSLLMFEDLDFDLAVAEQGRPFGFIDLEQVTVQFQGDNLTAGIDFAAPGQIVKRGSVLRHFEQRLRLCHDDDARRHVHQKIGDAAYLLGQCHSEQGQLPAARSAYVTSLTHAPSWQAAKALALACLPVPVFKALKRVRSRVVTRP